MNQKYHYRGENRQDDLEGPVGPAGAGQARLGPGWRGDPGDCEFVSRGTAVPRRGAWIQSAGSAPLPHSRRGGDSPRNAGQTLEIRIRVARIARVSSGSPSRVFVLLLSTC